MKLLDYCQYNSEKISINMIDNQNYVSTENMLPNRGGIIKTSNIPRTGNINQYRKGDILISNIRPYFKKIWHANQDGGCSADVLCIRANENISNDYLYYLLSQQKFFDYVMAGAKGCKMPRGDKQHIMQWDIEISNSKQKQEHIVSILRSLDDKIELNNRINANLEEQAQALFRRWFVDFEFPNNQGLPYKSHGGRFVDSELGKIPEGWKVGNLFNIATLFDSKRKPLSNIQRASRKGKYPYYGATSIMDYVDDYLFDGTFLLMGEDGSVVNEQGYPFLQYVTGKFWANNHAHIMQGKNGFSTEMLYCMMKMTNISNLVTGAVQAKLSQTNMNKILFPLATKDILKYFSKMIEPLYALLRKNVYENQTLIQLRDLLLPKLMSGETI